MINNFKQYLSKLASVRSSRKMDDAAAASYLSTQIDSFEKRIKESPGPEAEQAKKFVAKYREEYQKRFGSEYVSGARQRKASPRSKSQWDHSAPKREDFDSQQEYDQWKKRQAGGAYARERIPQEHNRAAIKGLIGGLAAMPVAYYLGSSDLYQQNIKDIEHALKRRLISERQAKNLKADQPTFIPALTGTLGYFGYKLPKVEAFNRKNALRAATGLGGASLGYLIDQAAYRADTNEALELAKDLKYRFDRIQRRALARKLAEKIETPKLADSI